MKVYEEQISELKHVIATANSEKNAMKTEL